MLGLKFSNVSKSYFSKKGQKNQVLKNLSFNFDKGRFYCIFGPSGYGKTTILNLIAGIIKPDNGRISFYKNPDDKKEKISLKDIKLGYVFQTPNLFNWKTVFENLDVILQPLGYVQKKREGLIFDYLKLVGLSEKYGNYPLELSEGEKQRLNLIRSLIIKPELVLMDEPLAHLDEYKANLIRRELIEMWNVRPTTVIFVTHNILEAIYLADRILVLSRKPVKELKTFEVNIDRPRDKKLYQELINNPTAQQLIKNIQNEIM